MDQEPTEPYLGKLTPEANPGAPTPPAPLEQPSTPEPSMSAEDMREKALRRINELAEPQVESEVTMERPRGSSEFSVATVNTQRGQALTAEDGLGDLAGTDLLLFQELIQSPEEVAERVTSLGYQLVHYAPQFGVAIALHEGSDLQLIDGTVREHQMSDEAAPNGASRAYAPSKAINLPNAASSRPSSSPKRRGLA